ncbi:MAG: hypothetical protein ABL983_25660, partial [Nitrospira sp.]
LRIGSSRRRVSVEGDQGSQFVQIRYSWQKRFSIHGIQLLSMLTGILREAGPQISLRLPCRIKGLRVQESGTG